MSMMNGKDMKRMMDGILSHFPQWRIESIVEQGLFHAVFWATRGPESALIQVTDFSSANKEMEKAIRKQWQDKAYGYTVWLNVLCGIKDADCLALPVEWNMQVSAATRKIKMAYARLPEMMPLDVVKQGTLQVRDVAVVFRTVCRALQQCRMARVPHGEIIRQNLFQRPDGTYCLSGMLDPQRLEDCNLPIPREGAQVQQAALLMQELLAEVAPAGRNAPGARMLQEMIDRAAIGGGNATLQQTIHEIDHVLPLLEQVPFPVRADNPQKEMPVAPLRDMTDFFSDNAAVQNQPEAEQKSQFFDVDIEKTVGVRWNKTEQMIPEKVMVPEAEEDLDKTVRTSRRPLDILQKQTDGTDYAGENAPEKAKESFDPDVTVSLSRFSGDLQPRQ